MNIRTGGGESATPSGGAFLIEIVLYRYERNQPWKYYVNWINTVVIEDGVAGVGSAATLPRSGLEEIIFRGDVSAIGEGAFNKLTLTAKYPRRERHLESEMSA